MYVYEPVMFHKAYPLEEFLEEGKWIEKERERMLSYLPEEYGRMQKKVEEVCDRMEYEGSRMYDAHPDSEVIRRLVKNIGKELAVTQEHQEDVICCFLCNEMFLRRYRSFRSRRYIK